MAPLSSQLFPLIFPASSPTAPFLSLSLLSFSSEYSGEQMASSQSKPWKCCLSTGCKVIPETGILRYTLFLPLVVCTLDSKGIIYLLFTYGRGSSDQSIRTRFIIWDEKIPQWCFARTLEPSALELITFIPTIIHPVPYIVHSAKFMKAEKAPVW